MDLQILPVEPGDDRALHALLTLPQVADTYGGSPAEPVSAIRARIEGNDPELVHRMKAVLGGKLVGLATLEIPPSMRRRHSGRISIAVHPEVWRRGVGSRLVQTLTDAADRWLGLARLELDVRATNEAAVGLYRKHGFEVEATRRNGDVQTSGGPLDALHMARLRPGLPASPVFPAPPAPAPGPKAPARIRPLEPEDAAAVGALSREESVLRGTLRVPTTSGDFWRRRIAGNDPAVHRMLVAEVDGKLAGMGGIHGVGNPRFSHMAGLGMLVSAEFQGRGVGRQLTAALLDIADRFLGLRRVELEVYPDNERAIRLYRSAGFVREGTLRAYAFREGSLCDAELMARVR